MDAYLNFQGIRFPPLTRENIIKSLVYLLTTVNCTICIYFVKIIILNTLQIVNGVHIIQQESSKGDGNNFILIVTTSIMNSLNILFTIIVIYVLRKSSLFKQLNIYSASHLLMLLIQLLIVAITFTIGPRYNLIVTKFFVSKTGKSEPIIQYMQLNMCHRIVLTILFIVKMVIIRYNY